MYAWVMSHICMSHVTHVNELCLTYGDVAHMTPHMCHVTCLNESCRTCTNESCHTCERVMSHIWMSHVTRITHISMHHKAHMSWLIYTWLIHMTGLIHLYHMLPRHIHTHTRTHTFTHIDPPPILALLYMGWLRLVGPLKLRVSFAKEPCKRDYILQKRPINLRSLHIVATP